MPRLSLYKPYKGNDYKFMDRSIREQFDIGGTAVHVHKYLGPKPQEGNNDPSEPNYGSGLERDFITGEEINPEGIIDETQIQDLLFMENRDRHLAKYSSGNRVVVLNRTANIRRCVSRNNCEKCT